MKQTILIAGMMFAFSTVAMAAGMGAGNMSAADKAAMHNKMSTMSAADKAAMRSSMGAGNVGGAGMNHGTGSMGKGAMTGQGVHGTPNQSHDAAQHAAMQNTAATATPVQAQ